MRQMYILCTTSVQPTLLEDKAFHERIRPPVKIGNWLGYSVMGLLGLLRHSFEMIACRRAWVRMPQDDQGSGCNTGYASVNCTSSEAVLHFSIKWHRKSWHKMYPNSQKTCQLSKCEGKKVDSIDEEAEEPEKD